MRGSPTRRWTSACRADRAPRGSLLTAPERLTIASYNLLAPIYVRPIDERTGTVQGFAAFEWASAEDLDWERRRPRLLAELEAKQHRIRQSIQRLDVLHRAQRQGLEEQLSKAKRALTALDAIVELSQTQWALALKQWEKAQTLLNQGHISQADYDAGWVIAQNDSGNSYNPDLWSKFEWTSNNGEWYYCQSAYAEASEADAIAAA